MKVCVVCGKKFKPVNACQIYCTVQCRRFAERQREDEKRRVVETIAIRRPCQHIRCKSCVYRRFLSSNGSGIKACHYAVDTDGLRNCPPKNCDKYKPRGRKREQP